MRKRTLKAAFSVAVSRFEYLRDNPFRGVKPDKVTEPEKRYVTPAEFAAMIEACDSLWWQALLTVCYTAALRLSEVLNLTWADVDFGSDVVKVTPKPDGRDTIAWTPKGYEVRMIPVPAETMRLLMELHETAPPGHAYAFLSPDRIAFIQEAKRLGTWSESRLAINNFHHAMTKLVKRAAERVRSLVDGEGKTAVTLHDLRKTAITNWSKAVNPQTLRAMAGHSDIQTTMRYYASVTDDQLALVRQASAASRQTDPRLTPEADSGTPTTGASHPNAISDKGLGKPGPGGFEPPQTDPESVVLPLH